MLNENAKTAGSESAAEVPSNVFTWDQFQDGILEAAAMEITVCGTTSPRPCNDC
jgi:hypothetical protein